MTIEEIAKTQRVVAAKILHELELALDTRVGVLENDQQLVEAILPVLDDVHETVAGECKCACKICSLADH
jgi:hypothetical protein